MTTFPHLVLGFTLAASALAGFPGFSAACPSDLDPSFGNDGVSNVSIPGAAGASADDAVVTGDGSIVAVGAVNNAGLGPLVMRYDATGKLDASFGHNGAAILDMLGGFDAVALQQDGSIVAAGVAYTDHYTTSSFLVARFDKDGDLDETFGDGGIVTTQTGPYISFARDVVVRSDGAIVAIGQGRADDPYAQWKATAVYYTPQGELDDSFGDGGVVTVAPDLGTAVATGGALTGDDSLVIAGIKDSAKTFVARLHPDGTPDTGFGDMGRTVARAAAHEEAWAVAFDGDGRILVSGNSSKPFVGPATKIFVRRFLADGARDRDYGNRGKAVIAFGRRIYPRGLAVTEDGSAIVPAYFFRRHPAVLTRFTSDGKRDRTFGDYGVARLDAGDGPGFTAAVLQDDGKIVVAGFANQKPLLARYDGGAWDGIEQCVIGCGDSILGPHEQCDDGNAASGDGCSAACLLE